MSRADEIKKIIEYHEDHHSGISVIHSPDALAQALADSEAERVKPILDCLYDMWWQFSCDSVKDGKKVKNDMGMSSLEWCKDVLVEHKRIELDKWGNHLLKVAEGSAERVKALKKEILDMFEAIKKVAEGEK